MYFKRIRLGLIIYVHNSLRRTHDELMSIKRGRYRRLVDTQMRGSQLDLATLRELMYRSQTVENDPNSEVKMDDSDKADDKTSKQDDLDKMHERNARSMALQDWKSIFIGAVGAVFAGGVFPCK